MYAIVDIAGEQFKVEKDDQIVAPKLAGEVGDKIELEKVMMLAGKGPAKIGTPYIEGAKVQATIVEHNKAKKVPIFKKIRTEGYTLFKGHRQQHTKLKIDKIIA